jgi:hypothetical protein
VYARVVPVTRVRRSRPGQGWGSGALPDGTVFYFQTASPTEVSFDPPPLATPPAHALAGDHPPPPAESRRQLGTALGAPPPSAGGVGAPTQPLRADATMEAMLARERDKLSQRSHGGGRNPQAAQAAGGPPSPINTPPPSGQPAVRRESAGELRYAGAGAEADSRRTNDDRGTVKTRREGDASAAGGGRAFGDISPPPPPPPPHSQMAPSPPSSEDAPRQQPYRHPTMRGAPPPPPPPPRQLSSPRPPGGTQMDAQAWKQFHHR